MARTRTRSTSRITSGQRPSSCPCSCIKGRRRRAACIGWNPISSAANIRTTSSRCQFNLRKVSRHVLKPSGATFATEDSDFVVSDNTDFHPTDVIEDADGSLLVVNTGGWYKLCCPSSQLVKDDVLGGIYRVRRTGAHRLERSARQE